MDGRMEGWTDGRTAGGMTVSDDSDSSEESGSKRNNHIIMMKRTMGDKEHF